MQSNFWYNRRENLLQPISIFAGTSNSKAATTEAFLESWQLTVANCDGHCGEVLGFSYYHGKIFPIMSPVHFLPRFFYAKLHFAKYVIMMFFNRNSRRIVYLDLWKWKVTWGLLAYGQVGLRITAVHTRFIEAMTSSQSKIGEKFWKIAENYLGATSSATHKWETGSSVFSIMENQGFTCFMLFYLRESSRS